MRGVGVRPSASLALAFLLALPGAALAGLPPGVPPDGPAGPWTSLLDVEAGRVSVGTPVTIDAATVESVDCPSCDSATVAASFVLKDANGTALRVEVTHSWQPTFNVKKQNFVPQVGMTVVVQGAVARDAAGWLVEAKRWAERDHAAPTGVLASDVARGDLPTGAYVWLAPSRVLDVGWWNDGDRSFDLVDPGGNGSVFVHAELPPPFQAGLHVPHAGDVVTPFGMVRFDPDHGWWEIHPVRCWTRSECAPLAASYVENGPPAGTPRVGRYVEGTPPASANATEEPPAVAFENVTLAASWVSVRVATTTLVRSVEASVDDGAWTPLDPAGAAWRGSLSLVVGDVVRFRATMHDGAGATSAPYRYDGPGAPVALPEPAEPDGLGGTALGGSATGGTAPAESSGPLAPAGPPREAPGVSFAWFALAAAFAVSLRHRR